MKFFQTPARELRQVLVTSTHHKPAAHALTRHIAERFKALGVHVIVDLAGTLPIEGEVQHSDLVISVGGDGTLLTTARRQMHHPLPTIGVNLGKLGFLAEHDAEDVFAYIDGKVPENWHFSPKMMLTARLERTGETHVALNDVFVSQGVMTRLINIDMDVAGEHATQYRADGLVVSTPVGSTGYSLSLGGPILGHEMRAFVVIPIAPHKLTDRPIIIEGSMHLRFTIRSPAHELALIADGHERIDLELGDSFVVEAAPNDFLLISSDKRSSYEILRGKLSWGEQPKLSGDPDAY